MNRTLLLGIGLFLGVVCLAMMDATVSTSLAGHGCCGCHGYHACHGCYGCAGCAGSAGCAGCAGVVVGCAGCAGVVVGCEGAVVPAVKDPPPEPPIPPKNGASEIPPPEPSGPPKANGGMETTSLILRVPTDATVFLAGQATRTTGSVRQYDTSALPRGRSLRNYNVRVEVLREGHKVVKERTIVLNGGRRHELSLDITATDIAQAAGRSRQ